MKRIVTLMLAIAMVAGAAFNAAATDVNVSGDMWFYYQWSDNSNFNDADSDGDSEDDFMAAQRIRTQVEFVNEGISGVLNFEIDQHWGKDGGALDTNAVNLETRRAFLDFEVPGTGIGVRLGDQGLALPGAVAGSAVMDTAASSVLVDYTFSEMFDAKAFWARIADDGAESKADDEHDVFGVIAGVHMDGVEFLPYAVYGRLGADTENADEWFVGAATTISMIDKLTVGVDLAYGDVDYDETEANDQSGWVAATKISYALDMVTPGIVAWYGTGDDDDASDGSERMPEVDASWTPTTFGFDGGSGPTTYNILGDTDGDSPAGMWAVGLVFEDIKLIEDLTSTVRVFYYHGTNDAELVEGVATSADASGNYLTDEDSAWEINFDHSYAIYENLTLGAEMGYIKLDLDEDTWALNGDDKDFDDAAWKAAFILNYSF